MIQEKNIAVIGPGRMGIGIVTALLSCNRRLRIKLIDLKERGKGQEHSALNRAKHEIESNLKLLEALGNLQLAPSQLMKGVSFLSDLREDLADCAVIFEALPEKPNLKQEFIKRIEPLLDPKAIIASATSTIDLQTFWDVSSAPERIVTAHWLNPAFIIPLVEVSISEKTARWASDSIKNFLMEIGKIPVTVKDSPGFIVPRIQVAAMNEAVRILEEGVATPEDVDTAIKAGFGFRLAVFGLVEFIDLGGLDILFHASRFLHGKLGQNQYKPLRTVVEKMKRGEIGPKSGKGFYDYSNVNTEALFNKRYRGLLELLNLIKTSETLSFYGGVQDLE
jgi:3-hydroxybutyryl-CoA dehydrogenase